MINYEDKLIDFNNNMEEYDEIIIGSPIWNARLSSPINTVLKMSEQLIVGPHSTNSMFTFMPKEFTIRTRR